MAELDGNKWYYPNGGKYITSVEEMPEKTIGFIYIIEYLPTGQKYIGKKLITAAASRVVKGKRKKFRKPSDWEEYWSSSPYLQELIEKEGKDKFTRKILMFCNSKGELNYCEEKLQYQWDVLESDNWFNSNIRSRIFGKHVEKYDLKRLKMVAMTYGDVHRIQPKERLQQVEPSDFLTAEQVDSLLYGVTHHAADILDQSHNLQQDT